MFFIGNYIKIYSATIVYKYMMPDVFVFFSMVHLFKPTGRYVWENYRSPLARIQGVSGAVTQNDHGEDMPINMYLITATA